MCLLHCRHPALHGAHSAECGQPVPSPLLRAYCNIARAALLCCCPQCAIPSTIDHVLSSHCLPLRSRAAACSVVTTVILPQRTFGLRVSAARTGSGGGLLLRRCPAYTGHVQRVVIRCACVGVVSLPRFPGSEWIESYEPAQRRDAHTKPPSRARHTSENGKTAIPLQL